MQSLPKHLPHKKFSKTLIESLTTPLLHQKKLGECRVPGNLLERKLDGNKKICLCVQTDTNKAYFSSHKNCAGLNR